MMNILNLSRIYIHVSGILLMPSKASGIFHDPEISYRTDVN